MPPSCQIGPSANSMTSSSRAAVDGRRSQAMRPSRSARQIAMVASAKARVPAGPKMRCGRSRPWCQLEMISWYRSTTWSEWRWVSSTASSAAPELPAPTSRCVTPEPQSIRNCRPFDRTRLAGPKRCGSTCGQPVPSKVMCMCAEPPAWILASTAPQARIGRSAEQPASLQIGGALVAVPKAHQMTPGIVVAKGGPAVRDLPIVDVQELARFEQELDPVVFRFDRLAHGFERVSAQLVQRLAGERVALVHVVVVIAREHPLARMPVDRRPAVGHVVRRMLGLPVPPERLV